MYSSISSREAQHQVSRRWRSTGTRSGKRDVRLRRRGAPGADGLGNALVDDDISVWPIT